MREMCVCVVVVGGGGVRKKRARETGGETGLTLFTAMQL